MTLVNLTFNLSSALPNRKLGEWWGPERGWVGSCGKSVRYREMLSGQSESKLVYVHNIVWQPTIYIAVSATSLPPFLPSLQSSSSATNTVISVNKMSSILNSSDSLIWSGQASKSGFNYEGRGKGKLSLVPAWVGAIVKIVMLLIFVTGPGLAWPGLM